MTIQTSLPLQELAQARLALYRFLQSALDKPTPEQYQWMTSPAFRKGLEAACASFGLSWPENETWPESFADFESRYLACFEVGLPAPPVPLLASHYNQREPAPRIIHEHILFCKCFGISLEMGPLEPADHLLSELAFLLRLDELLQQGRINAVSLLRARRDFLARHLSRWPAIAAAAALEKHLPPVYQCLLRLLALAVEEDLNLTRAALAQTEEST